jgi:hypothetical protein
VIAVSDKPRSLSVRGVLRPDAHCSDDCPSDQRLSRCCLQSPETLRGHHEPSFQLKAVVGGRRAANFLRSVIRETRQTPDRDGGAVANRHLGRARLTRWNRSEGCVAAQCVASCGSRAETRLRQSGGCGRQPPGRTGGDFCGLRTSSVLCRRSRVRALPRARG